MIRILTILGARPQFIKASSLSRAFKHSGSIEEVIIHTGQHYDGDMSDIFFEELDIPQPNYMLKHGGVSHGAMTGRMIESIEVLVLKEKPDYILVFGDTNSTLAGAIVASKLGVRLIHVEAGLRSFNMSMPEEVNRVLTDRVSDLLFCPTKVAVQNLKDEGFDRFKVKMYQVGDVMYDAALYFSKRAEEPHFQNYLLFTLHRQENTDNRERFEKIVQALNNMVRTLETKLVWPVHPRVVGLLNGAELDDRIILTKPLSYLQMIGHIKKSLGVITDSGGLQKEAFFFNKYCITLRGETEWIELLENGFNFLSEPEELIDSVKDILGKEFVSNHRLYGGGNAATEITQHIINYHNGNTDG